MISVNLENISIKEHNKFLLQDCNYTFPAGKFVLIKSESQSLKSILVKTCGGIYIPDKGKITYNKNGKSFTSLQNIQSGFVHQTGALLANTTLKENLLLPLHFNNRLNKDLYMKRYNELISVFNVTDLLDYRPSEVSVSERKTFGFIRALLQQPEIFFMDDPFSECVLQSVEKMYIEINKLKSNNITIIAIENLTSYFDLIADLILIIDNNNISVQVADIQ